MLPLFSNNLLFDKDPPTIVNNTHLQVLADVIFPTVGEGRLCLCSKFTLLIDGDSNDKAKVKVHVGDDVLSEGSSCLLLVILASQVVDFVTMPSGQGQYAHQS